MARISANDLRRVTFVLLVGFIFAVPWENAVHIAGIGRITKILGFLAIVFWMVSVLARGRLRHPDAFQKAYFLFLIWNGFTVWWTVSPDTSWRGWITYTELFALMLMLWDLFDDQRKIRIALQAYVLGAYITSASIIYAFLTAPPIEYTAHHRFNALGYQTDGIALVCAIGGPAAWYLAARPGADQGSTLMRIVNYAYLPVAAFGLVCTGTRGATLASIPTLALILWSLRHAARPIVGIAALAAAIILIRTVAPPEMLARIGTAATVTELGEGALGGRLGLWIESGAAFLERPIYGYGIDSHRSVIPEGKEAHNTYVSVLTETGVVGFALFVWVLISVGARVWEQRIRGWEGWYWSAQVTVPAIGGMSLSLEDSKSLWIMFSLAVASAAAMATQPLVRPRAVPLAYRPAVRREPVRVPERLEDDEVDRLITALMTDFDGAAEPTRPAIGSRGDHRSTG